MRHDDHALAGVRETDAARDLRASHPIKLVCATDVAPQRVNWLWERWLPRGKLVAIDGSAGVGKSTLVLDLIARATRGGPMPYEERRFSPVTALIAGVEDGWADTIRPRLDAANADLARVHFVQMEHSRDTVSLPRDLRGLADEAVRVGATWLHIDALFGVLDEDVNANSDHEMRRALAPIGEWADARGLVVSFIRHPRKQAASAINAGGGSVAGTAVARMQLYVGYEPSDTLDQNDQRRVLAAGKSKIAKLPTALAFRVVTAPNGVGCISWDGPVLGITADALASPPSPRAERQERAPKEKALPRADAVGFLRRVLEDGAKVPVETIQARAADEGFAWRTVQRAADDLCVSKKRSGFGGTTSWSLPVEVPLDPDAIGATSPPLLPSMPRSPYIENAGTNGTNDRSVALMDDDAPLDPGGLQPNVNAELALEDWERLPPIAAAVRRPAA